MTIDEIRRKKKEFGYSNEKIAELSGLPLSTVQKVLSGTTRSPRRSTILALESVFPKETASFSYGNTESRPKYYVREPSSAYSVPHYLPDTPQDRFPNQGSYTIEDYLALPDDQRVELIDGVFYDMSAPTTPHQVITMRLTVQLFNFISANHGQCMVFAAPTDVQLDCDDKTIVQPDVFVVCDRSKLNKARLFGAPDFAIEVLSPSTRSKDILIKTAKYMKAGVKEYWQIDPQNETIVKYIFLPPDSENPEGNIKINIFGFSDSVPVTIFNDECVINFKEIRDYYSFIDD